jgi:hypothetical protein
VLVHVGSVLMSGLNAPRPAKSVDDALSGIQLVENGVREGRSFAPRICGSVRQGLGRRQPRKGQARQFDLVGSNRLARHGDQTDHVTLQISAGRWAFPLRPDGGRKDCKVSRVVEMECASRNLSW